MLSFRKENMLKNRKVILLLVVGLFGSLQGMLRSLIGRQSVVSLQSLVRPFAGSTVFSAPSSFSTPPSVFGKCHFSSGLTGGLASASKEQFSAVDRLSLRASFGSWCSVNTPSTTKRIEEKVDLLVAKALADIWSRTLDTETLIELLIKGPDLIHNYINKMAVDLLKKEMLASFPVKNLQILLAFSPGKAQALAEKIRDLDEVRYLAVKLIGDLPGYGVNHLTASEVMSCCSILHVLYTDYENKKKDSTWKHFLVNYKSKEHVLQSLISIAETLAQPECWQTMGGNELEKKERGSFVFWIKNLKKELDGVKKD